MVPTDGRFIAIVDDDELFRRSMERFVRSIGIRVATFSSAEDFLGSAELNRIACAILDIRLPGMDGLDLHQRILAGATPIPVVFVSAHGEANARTQAMRAGAIAFLKKPFDNSALLEALNRALDDGWRVPCARR